MYVFCNPGGLGEIDHLAVLLHVMVMQLLVFLVIWELIVRKHLNCLLKAVVAAVERQHEIQVETDCESCHDRWWSVWQCDDCQSPHPRMEHEPEGLNYYDLLSEHAGSQETDHPVAEQD